MGRAWTAIAAAALCVLAAAAGGAAAAIGDLDRTFSGDGKLVEDVSLQGVATDVVSDGQNRVLVAARVDTSAFGSDFAVARYLATGALDESYGGGDGIFTLDVGASAENDVPLAIALDSQGRAAVGGLSRQGADSRVAIIRLTDAGALDSSFGGGDGTFLQDFDAANDDDVQDLAIDAAGRIVATGLTGAPAGENALTLRLTAQGALDTSFSAPYGFASLNVNSVSSRDFAKGVAVDSAGRIVIAGETSIAAGQENFMAARYLSSGELDAGFSSNPAAIPGRSILDLSAGVAPSESDGAEALQIAAGNRPVLGGFAEPGGGDQDDLALLRLTAAGAPDGSFSGDGAAYVDYGGAEFGRGLAIDAAGRAVIAGFGDTGPAEFAVARFLPDGEPDPSFSGDGKLNTDIVAGASDLAENLTIDRGGRPVVVGSTIKLVADWAVARYEGVPRCAGKVPTLTGTPGKDVRVGTERRDVISGGAGKDTILGRGKADLICGEAGRDKLRGGKGNDRLFGGKGKDTLIGGKGNGDVLRGGKGRDVEQP